MEPVKRYIFIVSRPAGAATDPSSLIGALEMLGIQVDHKYGVVAVDSLKLRFVLRGTAQADVLERVTHDSSIEVFVDSQIENM